MATGLASSQVASEGTPIVLAERHDFQEVGRGFWKAGWAEVGRQAAHKSRDLK